MKRLIVSGKLKRLLAFIVVTALLVAGVSAEIQFTDGVKASSDALSKIDNPRRENNVTTWDCVYFGHYYQTYNDEYNGSNEEYFNEAIKWRVLEKKDGELLLMSDRSIESIQYDQDYAKPNPDTGKVDLSWANSDLREWLNDDFYKDAFNLGERSDISKSTVTADLNPIDKTVEQGPDTQDYVYILSAKEALTEKYGFVSNGIDHNSNTRVSVNTDYGHRVHRNKLDTLGFNDGYEDTSVHPWILGYILSQNYENYTDAGIWWLRTVKSYNSSPYYMYRVDYDGSIKQKPASENNACVRPVIKVDQDSEYLKYAGTVNSNNEEVIYCGENAKASFDRVSNTLRIFGSGPMYDFGEDDAPWHKYRNEIYTVVVDEQVTSVGRNAFHDCENISYMYLNENVTEFSSQALQYHTQDFLVSVEKDSIIETIVGTNLNLNYTNIRSKSPLAIDIKDLYDISFIDGTLNFSFNNPMAGQSYEVSVDNELVQVIEDDIEHSKDVIDVVVNNLDSGKHIIKVNPLVVGSKGLERRRAGKIVRVNDDGYSNPVWEDKKTEKVHWDCVYFGTFPQSEDADGDWTEDGKTYKREPIMWRVLENEGDTLLLMADKSLDNRQFDSKTSAEWNNCSLRSWLNDDTGDPDSPSAGFITRAFNSDEQSALVTTTTSEGTKDKVFTLSRSEMERESYGFLTDPIKTKTRRSNATDYCGRKNKPSDKWPVYVDIATWSDSGKPPSDPSDTYHKRATIYWLNNKHTTGTNRARVNYQGNTDEGKAGNGTNACVRPFIRVSAFSNAIQDAGSIDSYGNYTPPAKKYTIQIDGHVVDTVKEGSTYTLPEESNRKKSGASVSNGVKIGYIDLDNPDDAYRKGTTFTIDRDRAFKSISSVDLQHGGAGVRVSKTKPRGIAFRSIVSINEDDPMHTKAFQYGVLVTSYDDWYDVYDQNIEPDTEEVPGHRLYNVLFGKNDFVKTNAQYFTVAINNLKQANNTRQFVVKPYVLVHYQDGGGTDVVYADEPYTMCSAAQSATNIMSDKTKWPSAYSQWQRDIIEYYLTTE